MLEKRGFYIGGRWVARACRNDLEVIDPSSEEPCAVIPLGAQADTRQQRSETDGNRP
jgi:aldehyde dehydrogenase (NAD+)